MSKYLHIQQFNRALDHSLDLQVNLGKMGYTMLGNGQSFQQFGQKATLQDHSKESWLLDIYPMKKVKILGDLPILDADFSGVYLHKMKFSVDLFRDVFGVKSLYYYFEDGLLIASNDLRSILASLPKVPDMDAEKIAAYFKPQIDDGFITENTFFKGIKRVLPGQNLHFRAGTVESSFFWKPEFKPGANIKSEAPVHKNFRQRLLKSTLDKLPTTGNVAANLSGGLDSSSLCSIISQTSNYSLKGIFFNTKLSAEFEKTYAHEVSKNGNFTLKETIHTEDSYEALKRITAITCKPESMVIPSSIFLPIMEEASTHKSPILVAGHGGDAIVGYGHEYITHLISKKQFKEVKIALQQKWELLDETEKDDFENYFIRQVLVHASQNKKRLVISMFLSSSFSKKHLMALIVKALQKPNEPKIDSILAYDTPKNKQESSIEKWYSKFCNSHQKLYLKNNLLALGANALETLDSLDKHFGITSVYPFLDKELLVLGANAKSKNNFDNGYLRGTLRASMKGIVPENIRLRTKKAAFNDFSLATFIQLEEQTIGLFPEKHLLWKFVNRESYHLHLQKVLAEDIPLNQKGKELWLCNRTLYLGIWLDEFYTS